MDPLECPGMGTKEETGAVAAEAELKEMVAAMDLEQDLRDCQGLRLSLQASVRSKYS